MAMINPIDLLAGLSSISTIAKNVREIFTSKQKINKNDVPKVIAVAERSERYASRSPASGDAIRQISKELFEPLEERIKRARSKLEENLRDSYASKRAVLRAVTESEEDICFALSLIKKFNGGVLPTKKLRDLWKEHGCNDEKVI